MRSDLYRTLRNSGPGTTYVHFNFLSKYSIKNLQNKSSTKKPCCCYSSTSWRNAAEFWCSMYYNVHLYNGDHFVNCGRFSPPYYANMITNCRKNCQAVAVSEGLGTRKQILRYPELAEKWVYGKLNKAVLNLFAKCLA